MSRAWPATATASASRISGATRFERSYEGNPLVNAFALGTCERRDLDANATGLGNPVIMSAQTPAATEFTGQRWPREELTEARAERPDVQMGDPFMEKLLLEACLEAMATGAVLGIQDMGAAGSPARPARWARAATSD